MFSDRCAFYISKLPSNQNTRVWDTETPGEIPQHDLHNKKVAVWCSGRTNGVGGPYYTIDKPVNVVHYHQTLNTYIQSEAQKFSKNVVFPH